LHGASGLPGLPGSEGGRVLKMRETILQNKTNPPWKPGKPGSPEVNGAKRERGSIYFLFYFRSLCFVCLDNL